MAFKGSPGLTELSQHTVLQTFQEVTRPKARLKPTLPEMSEVDGDAIRWGYLLRNIVHSQSRKVGLNQWLLSNANSSESQPA